MSLTETRKSKQGKALKVRKPKKKVKRQKFRYDDLIESSIPPIVKVKRFVMIDGKNYVHIAGDNISMGNLQQGTSGDLDIYYKIGVPKKAIKIAVIRQSRIKDYIKGSNVKQWIKENVYGYVMDVDYASRIRSKIVSNKDNPYYNRPITSHRWSIRVKNREQFLYLANSVDEPPRYVHITQQFWDEISGNL